MGSARDMPAHPLLELSRARLLQFVRDPGAIFWTFGFPVLLAVGLGIAFRNQGSEVVRLAVTGEAGTSVAERMAGVEGLDVRAVSEEEGLATLRSGRVDLLVRANGEGASPAVTYRFDPTRPGAAASRCLADQALQKAHGRTDVISSADERVAEAGGRYIDFLIPGLLGLNIMGSCMWGTGYAMVESRRRRLVKRFATTPMNRSHYLLSYMLSRLLFLAAEVACLLVAGWLLFDVRTAGSVASLGLVLLLGSMSFSGLALLVGSRTESTEVAAGWMNFVQLPMWVLSGSFFAYERFPEVVHPVIRALPLTALNDAARAVMNEGASLVSVHSELAIMAAWGALSFVLALRLFRWQ